MNKVQLVVSTLFILSTIVFGSEIASPDSLQNTKLKGADTLNEKKTSLDMSKLKYSQLTDEKTLMQFLELVEAGNVDALDFLFRSRRYYKDNPYISELFDISAGKNINKNPKLFLTMLKKYWKDPKQSGFNLSGILGNYDEEYTDEFQKSIVETDRRIQALKKVDEIDLKELRDECVSNLLDHKKELEEALKEMGSDQ